MPQHKLRSTRYLVCVLAILNASLVCGCARPRRTAKPKTPPKQRIKRWLVSKDAKALVQQLRGWNFFKRSGAQVAVVYNGLPKKRGVVLVSERALLPKSRDEEIQCDSEKTRPHRGATLHAVVVKRVARRWQVVGHWTWSSDEVGCGLGASVEYYQDLDGDGRADAVIRRQVDGIAAQSNDGDEESPNVGYVVLRIANGVSPVLQVQTRPFSYKAVDNPLSCKEELSSIKLTVADCDNKVKAGCLLEVAKQDGYTCESPTENSPACNCKSATPLKHHHYRWDKEAGNFVERPVPKGYYPPEDST